MEEIDFLKYKRELLNAGIPEDDIYDFTVSTKKHLYQRYLDWSVDNLKDYGKIFGIEPTYFYFWDTHIINAKAGKGKNVYLIKFSKTYMEALHKKIGIKGQFFKKTDWVAFHNLQNVLPISLEYFMFQSSTIFTFYHEFAHLVQFKGKEFSMSEHTIDKNFSFEKHIFEYDADINGSGFVSIYIQQFFKEKIPQAHQTQNNYKRLIYIGISSIIITQILFLSGNLFPFPPDYLDTTFYSKENSHPHTYVRAKCIIENYIRIAKVNGVQVDFADTVRNISVICNEFFKDSNIFQNFAIGMNYHVNEINSYAHELFIGQQENQSCIKHKMKLFGFSN